MVLSGSLDESVETHSAIRGNSLLRSGVYFFVPAHCSTVPVSQGHLLLIKGILRAKQTRKVFIFQRSPTTLLLLPSEQRHLPVNLSDGVFWKQTGIRIQGQVVFWEVIPGRSSWRVKTWNKDRTRPTALCYWAGHHSRWLDLTLGCSAVQLNSGSQTWTCIRPQRNF